MKNLFSKNRDSYSDNNSNNNNNNNGSSNNSRPSIQLNSAVNSIETSTAYSNINSNSNNPRTPVTPTTNNSSRFGSQMPTTTTNKHRSHSLTNMLRSMSPSSNSANGFSPSKYESQLSSSALMTKALSPELVPVVTLLSAQTHRRYHVGVFLLFNDLNNEGQPAERVWKEQYAVLIGTQLALWNASELNISRNNKYTTNQMTEKLFNAASKPSYINFTDANFKVLPDKDNTLVVSTTMKNRYFFKFSDEKSFQTWHAAFRLCTFEYTSLQEAYTGAFLSAKGGKLSDIGVILADTKFKYEDWVSVRFGAGMPWKRCYAVVSQPTKSSSSSSSSSKLKLSGIKKGSKSNNNKNNEENLEKIIQSGEFGEVTFYENEKKINNKKYAMARIRSAFSVYAIYPSSPLLIDDSTMLKIEGMVTFGKDDKDLKESDVFIMPEKHFAVPGYDTIIRFLVPMLNAFHLYGRPQRLISTKNDPQSLLFGLPTLPEIHYLQVEDLLPLLKNNPSSARWNHKTFKREIQKILLHKLERGYSGCGSASGYSGALISPSITSVELFKKSKTPHSQPISRFISEGIPISHTKTSHSKATKTATLKTPINQTFAVNGFEKTTQTVVTTGRSPQKKELVMNAQSGGAAYSQTPLKTTSTQSKQAQTLRYSPEKPVFSSKSPSSPYQQYKSSASPTPPGSNLDLSGSNETGTFRNRNDNFGTPLKSNQQQVTVSQMNQHKTVVDNFQRLDIGRDSVDSAESIDFNPPATSNTKNNHASLFSADVPNHIIDSYKDISHDTNSRSTVEKAPVGVGIYKPAKVDRDDYVLGNAISTEQSKNDIADPLADFRSLSRTLSSYKPLTSRAVKKKSEEVEQSVSGRPIMKHNNSSTILEDFQDAQENFDVESVAKSSTSNIFDPDYYEESSILQDRSVNAMINDPIASYSKSTSKSPSGKLPKSPNMKDVSVPKFSTDILGNHVKKSPKINDFNSTGRGQPPVFQHGSSPKVGSPSSQFINGANPASPFQTHQASSYGRPYENASMQNAGARTSPYPTSQVQQNPSPHQYQQQQPYPVQNSGGQYAGGSHRPEPPRAMSGGRKGYPSPQQNKAHLIQRPMPPMQGSRQMPAQQAAKKAPSSGFSQFMPPSQGSNPYGN